MCECYGQVGAPSLRSKGGGRKSTSATRLHREPVPTPPQASATVYVPSLSMPAPDVVGLGYVPLANACPQTLARKHGGHAVSRLEALTALGTPRFG